MKARNPSELWKNKLQSMMEKSSDICSRNKKIYSNVLLHECDPPILPHTHTHTPAIHNAWQQFSLQFPRRNTKKGFTTK